METVIKENDQGKFRGLAEAERLRKRLIANYKEVDKKTGRNKIDAIFDN
jgi:hypothetical protein